MAADLVTYAVPIVVELIPSMDTIQDLCSLISEWTSYRQSPQDLDAAMYSCEFRVTQSFYNFTGVSTVATEAAVKFYSNMIIRRLNHPASKLEVLTAGCFMIQ